MQLSTGMREWLKYLSAARGYSPATITNYDRTCNQFLRHVGDVGLRDECASFSVETVTSFYRSLGERGIHPNTIANKRHCLSTLARYLMKRKDGRGRYCMTENAALIAEGPKEVQPKTKFLHAEELRRFMALPLSPEMALVREVLVDTMIRRQEAVEANVGNLRDQDGTVYLDIQVKGRRGVNAEPRAIPLSPQLVEMVKDSLLRRGLPDPGEPLLVDERGHRFTVSQLTSRMMRLGKRAGIFRLVVSPHRIRHTSASIVWSETQDRVLLAELLNHQGTRHVERYIHLLPGASVEGRAAQRRGMARYLGCEAPLPDTPDAVNPKPLES